MGLGVRARVRELGVKVRGLGVGLGLGLGRVRVTWARVMSLRRGSRMKANSIQQLYENFLQWLSSIVMNAWLG